MQQDGGKDVIRQSTDADLKAIHSWLKNEEKAGVHGNFLCNWGVIKRLHVEGGLLVYVDASSKTPVAFQLGGLLGPGILQVRSDMRHKGIGKKVVDYCIAKAVENDESFLVIDCKPSSSVPFWERMGFTLFDQREKRGRAYRILHKQHQLPAGEPIDVLVQFYPEARKYAGGENIPPYDVPKPKAARTTDGTIHFSERMLFFKDLHPEADDPLIEIVVDGKRLYLDKAKYPEAKRLGIERCGHGYRIDKIFPQDAPRLAW